MSTTHDILKQVKGLVTKIKQKDEKIQNENSANKALINSLLQMENSYKEKNIKAAPDYSNVFLENTQPALQLKDENALKKEASQYISNLANENLKKINESTKNKLENIEGLQIAASEKQKEKAQKASNNFEDKREKIGSSTIRQGITNSSIKQSWLDSNVRGYVDSLHAIKNEYATQIKNLDRQIDIIKSSKEQSLYDYNLKLASEYEKKLAKLKDEQLKAIEKLGTYEKLEEKNQNQITKLEMQWEKEQQQIEDEQLQRELQEGYTGEKALEMENRYKTALEFYEGVDRATALKMIEKNKEDLKETLGLYYTRLIKDINK